MAWMTKKIGVDDDKKGRGWQKKRRPWAKEQPKGVKGVFGYYKNRI